MEVYIDDMLVKSIKAELHITHLAEAFQVLRSYSMKLNPVKCAFGLSYGKFLGFIVNNRGIEANPNKIKVVVDMLPPSNAKDTQRLTGRVVALSRFVSKANGKCRPFFQVLKRPFQWDAHCQEAFTMLKTYLSPPPPPPPPPIMVSPSEGELLTLYLAVSDFATSAALVRERDRVQQPIYFYSQALRGGGGGGGRRKVPKDGKADPGIGNHIQETPTLLPSLHHRSPNRISNEANTALTRNLWKAIEVGYKAERI